MPIDLSPSELADIARPLLPNALIAFDVDGVLAPLVEHADDAVLSPGVAESLTSLGRRTDVAIISGRSVATLDNLFAFPPEIVVVGSHGLEQRGAPPLVLDERERATLDQLTLLGSKAVEAAGAGAWLEHKPASVVVHVRAADPDRAAPALAALRNLAGMVVGAAAKPGHMVLELLARGGSKGDALDQLRREGQPVVFLGDDVTDESAFERMGDTDVAVRVGHGPTAARYRLAGTEQVVEFLTLI